MIANFAVFLVLQSQSHVQDGVKFDSKELDPKTRPIIELPQFKDMKCVTVSSYRWTNEKTKKLEVTRVFRFTYKADFVAETEKWMKTYVKQGWHRDPKDKAFILDRDYKHPKVIRQGLLLHDGKAVFDPKVTARTKSLKEAGWVWVSMNETIKDPAW